MEKSIRSESEVLGSFSDSICTNFRTVDKSSNLSGLFLLLCTVEKMITILHFSNLTGLL